MPLCNVAVNVYLVIILMVHNRFILLQYHCFKLFFILYVIEIQIQINKFGIGTQYTFNDDA